MKKLAIAIGLLIVLAVIAIALLPFVVDVNRYRSQIQAELESKTGRPVSLGHMELKVFPFAFRVQDFVMGEDRAFPQTHAFAQAKEVYVSARLIPLIQGQVDIDSLELRKPVIELIRNRQGVWNFASMGKASLTGTSPSSQGHALTLANLKVIDGQVAITDQQKKQPRAIYDHIDLAMQGFASGKQFPITFAAHMPGAGAETISFKGSMGPLQENNFAATNFAGDLKLDQVSFSGLEKFLNSASPAMSGLDFNATGTTHISSANGNVTSNGDLTLANGRVNGVEIGYPISMDYNLAADLNRDQFTIQKGSLKLGATPLSVTGTVNAAPTPAVVELKVNASNASIAEVARLAAAFGVAFNPRMQVNGKLDADLTARGPANNPALNGTMSARELVISGKDLPQAVQVTGVNLAITPELLRSNEFVASTGSTSVKANFELRNYTAKNSSMDGALHANNAQLGELLNIAKAYGVSAVEGMSGTGPVSLDLRVQGPTKNPEAMTYSGDGTLQNDTLNVPTLTKPIHIKYANLRFSQNIVMLDRAEFALGSTNASGQMTLKGLAGNAAPQVQFALNADKFDVTEWQQMLVNGPVQNKKTAFSMSMSIVPLAEAQKNTIAHSRASAASSSLLTRVTGNGTVQVGTVVYDQTTLTNVKSNVVMDHGVIKLSPFTAQVFGGSETGSIVMDTRPTPATYSVTTKLDHVDANQLLSSVSSIKKTLYGMLAANTNASFTSGGGSSDIARTLNGTASLNLQNGKIAHIDLLNELASIGKFVQTGKASEPFTNLVKLTGDFNIKNGVAQTNNLNAVIDGGSLAARGAINLATEALDMQVTAVLSKEYSQTVGGTGIGGYLSTALANNKGELVMPILISGTFSQPRIVPDMKRIAELKLQNLLPSGNNPGALTTGILNGVLNRGTQGNGGQSNSVMGNVLDALGGRNKTNQDQLPQGDQKQPKQDNTEQPQQTSNPLNDILNSVMGTQQKKQQSTPPPPQQNPPPTQQPPPKQ